MSNLANLHHYLERVEIDIADTRARMAARSKEAQRARLSGGDPAPALRELETWKPILESMMSHRDNLAREIEAGLSGQDHATLAFETCRK